MTKKARKMGGFCHFWTPKIDPKPPKTSKNGQKPSKRGPKSTKIGGSWNVNFCVKPRNLRNFLTL